MQLGSLCRQCGKNHLYTFKITCDVLFTWLRSDFTTKCTKRSLFPQYTGSYKYVHWCFSVNSQSYSGPYWVLCCNYWKVTVLSNAPTTQPPSMFLNECEQRCEAAAQISGTGSSSRYLKFFAPAPAPTPKWFGYGSGSKIICSGAKWKTICVYHCTITPTQMRYRRMTCLVDSGTYAKRFENPRSTQERGELCTHTAILAFISAAKVFSHISISRFDVTNFVIPTRSAIC